MNTHNKAGAYLTRAFNRTLANAVAHICSRHHIDMNTIQDQGHRIVIGEPKTGLYLTISNKSSAIEGRHLINVQVTTVGGSYQERLDPIESGAITFDGLPLTPKKIGKDWGIWSASLGGFISFYHKNAPYKPAGGLSAAVQVCNSGIVPNCSIFIYKP